MFKQTKMFEHLENESIFHYKNDKCQPKRGMKTKEYKEMPQKDYNNFQNRLRS